MPTLLLLAVLAAAPSARADDGLHAPFDVLLARHVAAGIVDYRGLSADEPALGAYLVDLSRVDPASLDRDARMAFWINAYNAFTLQLILDHLGEIDSIKDISSGKRWKDERWLVDGKRYSLDQIEHEILRPMGDARIHFALVCASFSCPDLRGEAYTAAELDTQLDEQTRAFLANPTKGLKTVTESGFFGGEDHNLYLSALFDWFDDDFERDAGSVIAFVEQYAPDRAREYIRAHRDDLDVEYLDYDWSLNDR